MAGATNSITDSPHNDSVAASSFPPTIYLDKKIILLHLKKSTIFHIKRIAFLSRILPPGSRPKALISRKRSGKHHLAAPPYSGHSPSRSIPVGHGLYLISEIFAPAVSVVMDVEPKWSPRKYSTLMLCGMVYLRWAIYQLACFLYSFCKNNDSKPRIYMTISFCLLSINIIFLPFGDQSKSTKFSQTT